MDAGPRERKFSKKIKNLSRGGAWMRGRVNFISDEKIDHFYYVFHFEK
jgi:hypothetical protein